MISMVYSFRENSMIEHTCTRRALFFLKKEKIVGYVADTVEQKRCLV